MYHKSNNTTKQFWKKVPEEGGKGRKQLGRIKSAELRIGAPPSLYDFTHHNKSKTVKN